ncbi:probable serine/threonine-protein kinase clkA [Microplitis mediator]|uniref:probable serine/threonine-protein kinase clkA n=1 Tax=Microplitis mediator TaxID=375433 RepID=UPI0025526309|nr:probable serine/threonine-protein kinase clkA [Microplitis mediator]
MAGTSDKYFTMQGIGASVSASGQGEKAGSQASPLSDCSSSEVENLATGEYTIYYNRLDYTFTNGSTTIVIACDGNIYNPDECTYKNYDAPENSGVHVDNGKVTFTSLNSASNNGINSDFNNNYNNNNNEEELCPTETSGIIAINNDNNKVKNCIFDSITGLLAIKNIDTNQNTMTINHDSKEITIDNRNSNFNEIIINGNSERIIVNNHVQNIVDIIIAGNSEYIQVNNFNNNVCTISITGNNRQIDIYNGYNNRNTVTVKGLRGVINTISMYWWTNFNAIYAPTLLKQSHRFP